MKTQAEWQEIARNLTDRGRLIEAGFVALRFGVMDADAPPIQIEEMRLAFFAGAQHLFSSIMSILEPGAEPTKQDLKRMDLIAAELNEFLEQFKASMEPPTTH
jgi:hypothetical protein